MGSLQRGRQMKIWCSRWALLAFLSGLCCNCNSLLCGLPSYQLARVQSVLNAAARIIYGGKRFDLITSLLHDRLHWLRVPERVHFKLCLISHVGSKQQCNDKLKCINGEWQATEKHNVIMWTIKKLKVKKIIEKLKIRKQLKTRHGNINHTWP